jgi:hypothetical protein
MRPTSACQHRQQVRRPLDCSSLRNHRVTASCAAQSRPRARWFLPVDESAALRDRLLSEVAGLASQDSATSWARKALPTKNSLTAADAKLLEDAFEQKLAGFLPGESAGPVASGDAPAVSAPGSQEAGPGNSADPHQPTGIDKSVLAISVPRRYRNKEHLRFVIRQPCLLCGRKPSDPHHLRFVQPRALGRKASDEFAVPLCRTHHRAVHRAGDERAWWKATGIDPLKVARKLWKDTLVNKGHDQPNALQGTQTTVAPSADGLDGKAL